MTYNSGTINVSGSRPRGIQASSDGNGSATVITDAGTIINVSDPQLAGRGLCLFERHGHRGERVNCERGIDNHECRASDHRSHQPPDRYSSHNSGTNAPIFVTYTGPGITTVGGNGIGIFALSGSGNITVNSSGPINTTDGSNAIGIFADSGGTAR